MYDLLMEELPKAGYQRYEISNFARPGQESRHNQVYWHYDPICLRPCCLRVRRTETRDQSPEPDGLSPEEAPEQEELTPAERREELVFMNLRTAKGLSLEEFRLRTGEDFFHIYKEGFAHCQNRGWITRKGDRIRLTEQGMRYGNLAFEEFL